jgi:hypothetical protein
MLSPGDTPDKSLGSFQIVHRAGEMHLHPSPPPRNRLTRSGQVARGLRSSSQVTRGACNPQQDRGMIPSRTGTFPRKAPYGPSAENCGALDASHLHVAGQQCLRQVERVCYEK